MNNKIINKKQHLKLEHNDLQKLLIPRLLFVTPTATASDMPGSVKRTGKKVKIRETVNFDGAS